MANLPVPVWATNFAPGQFDTAASMNVIGNNGTFLTNPPLFVGTQSTVQSVPNSTWTALALDTTQTDLYGGHSNTTNSSRYTAQVTGWYTVCGTAAYVPNSTGFRTARIQVNGAAIPGAETYGPNNGTAESVIVTPTRDVYLTANDYVEVASWQNSGGALNTSVGGETRCALFVRYSHA
ncbi:hypothetical protein [Kitasatospora sp. CB02891]|uniref:hypothetical protein n=1 Tax=Kitasatospora sp. CB02891 TaxID=2020329 RepID=UPI000C2749B3|nr:hypothetical protein [Kitasatospora sp. CB02891]PJN22427.1 hypothetical protein CG736_28350 [Kitasatospora sp. CB02891]